MGTTWYDKGETVEVEGLNVHVVREGAGPSVVLGHGIPTAAHLYRDVAPTLAKTFDVIAFDWPGFGRSSKPRDWSYRYADYERVFDALLTKLGVDRLHGLAVHDLAGPILLDWLSRNPERVDRLAILNTTLYRKHWHPPLRAMLPALPVIGSVVRPFTGPKQVLDILHEVSPRMSREALDTYGNLLRRDDGMKALFNVYRTMPKSMGDIKGVRHRLKTSWHGPTHLIWGTGDPILPIENAHAFQRDLPQATLATVAAGHFLQEERPDFVADELHRFFTDGSKQPSHNNP